jgi:hypothetical protein
LPIAHSYNPITNSQEITFGSEITDITNMNWREEEAHSLIIICMAGKQFQINK